MAEFLLYLVYRKRQPGRLIHAHTLYDDAAITIPKGAEAVQIRTAPDLETAMNEYVAVVRAGVVLRNPSRAHLVPTADQVGDGSDGRVS